jgi:hypothetical protein
MHFVDYDFWISNVENNNRTHVGITCIKQFMHENDTLLADIIEAEYQKRKKPCFYCKKLTKNEDVLHTRYCKAYQEHLGLIQLQLEREEKYGKIKGRIEMNRLNPTKQAFIEENVQNRIINGTDLTPWQYNWLRNLTTKYPSRQRLVAPVPLYEWM